MGIVLHIKWIDFAIKHVGNQPKKSISSFAIERLYATGVADVDGAVCDNMCKNHPIRCLLLPNQIGQNPDIASVWSKLTQPPMEN
jgi:hypothetical protein